MSNLFSENLRRLRIKNGLSQQQLADKLFVDRSSIANWETGRRLPDAILIARLSEALGIDVSEMLSVPDESGDKPKVILVDDEKIILSGGLPILEEALPNAEITGFTVPSQALAFAKTNRIAIAFVDIEMGRISGMNLCRELLEITPRMNVIFLTAYRDYSFDAWQTGACGFLLKPLTVKAVHDSIKNLRYPIRELEV